MKRPSFFFQDLLQIWWFIYIPGYIVFIIPVSKSMLYLLELEIHLTVTDTIPAPHTGKTNTRSFHLAPEHRTQSTWKWVQIPTGPKCAPNVIAIEAISSSGNDGPVKVQLSDCGILFDCISPLDNMMLTSSLFIPGATANRRAIDPESSRG